MGCVSQDTERPKKSILRKSRKLGSNCTVTFSKGTWHHIKSRERKGPSQGVVQKCKPQERNRCAPKSEDRTQEDTLRQERCARREAWVLAKNVHNLNHKDKATFFSPAEACALLGPSSKKPKERYFCGRFQSIDAHGAKRF